MNLTEMVVGAGILLLGAIGVYFSVTFQFKPVKIDHWIKLLRYTETQKRLNVLVAALVAIAIGILLILNAFRIL